MADQVAMEQAEKWLEEEGYHNEIDLMVRYATHVSAAESQRADHAEKSLIDLGERLRAATSIEATLRASSDPVKGTDWGCYRREGEAEWSGNVGAWMSTAVYWRNRAEVAEAALAAATPVSPSRPEDSERGDK